MQIEYEEFLCGSTLLLLSRALSKQERSDVLDTQLFARLKADSECSMFLDYEGWLAVHREAQSALGWLVSAQRYRIERDVYCGVSKPVEDFTEALVALVSTLSRCRVRDVLQRFIELPTQHHVKQSLIRSGSQSTKGCSQLALGIVVVEPGPVLLGGNLLLESSQAFQDLCLGLLKGSIHTSLYKAELHESTFAMIREDLAMMMRSERDSSMTSIDV